MIELLVVMTLVIILASISMVQYRNSVTRAEEAALKENLFRMRDAMDQFYADKNKWPADLAELVSEGYIREIPDGSDHEVEGHLADAPGGGGPEQSRVGRRHRQRDTAAPIAPVSTERLTSSGTRDRVQTDVRQAFWKSFSVRKKGQAACASWPFQFEPVYGVTNTVVDAVALSPFESVTTPVSV